MCRKLLALLLFPVLSHAQSTGDFRGSFYNGTAYQNFNLSSPGLVWMNGVTPPVPLAISLDLTTTGNSLALAPTITTPHTFSSATNSFTGTGSGLTNLNASNLSSGTVAIARIPTGTTASTVATGNYIPIIKIVSASENVTNSSTLTNSTALQIPITTTGTYFLETLELVGSSAFATAGAKSSLNFTGAATFVGTAFRTNPMSVEPTNAAPTWGGTSDAMNYVSESANASRLTARMGIVIVTGTGLLSVQFAQSSAVASESATMLPGSFMKLQRVQP